jgi:hypothetical protein
MNPFNFFRVSVLSSTSDKCTLSCGATTMLQLLPQRPLPVPVPSACDPSVDQQVTVWRLESVESCQADTEAQFDLEEHKFATFTLTCASSSSSNLNTHEWVSSRQSGSQILPIRVDCSSMTVHIQERDCFGRVEREVPILHSITAHFFPGQLAGILGASGSGQLRSNMRGPSWSALLLSILMLVLKLSLDFPSGKSSLLNILANRTGSLPPLRCTGDLRFNGMPGDAFHNETCSSHHSVHFLLLPFLHSMGVLHRHVLCVHTVRLWSNASVMFFNMSVCSLG